jgi:microcompartment protein CcmL/EutN
MELDDAIVKARSRTLMAAKNLSRLMAEFEGEIQYCQEALTEVMDAADQLDALENAKYLQSRKVP